MGSTTSRGRADRRHCMALTMLVIILSGDASRRPGRSAGRAWRGSRDPPASDRSARARARSSDRTPGSRRCGTGLVPVASGGRSGVGPVPATAPSGNVAPVSVSRPRICVPLTDARSVWPRTSTSRRFHSPAPFSLADRALEACCRTPPRRATRPSPPAPGPSRGIDWDWRPSPGCTQTASPRRCPSWNSSRLKSYSRSVCGRSPSSPFPARRGPVLRTSRPGSASTPSRSSS